VPAISHFYGLTVKLYLGDHQPAHFHVLYGDHEALFSIDSLEMMRGELPRRAVPMVLEWATVHREELRAGWALAQAGKRLLPVPPLD
jgi:hypothetical protein